MDWISEIPKTRPDGTPAETKLTPQIIRWACQGGVDPERIAKLGFPKEALIALWNCRVAARECANKTKRK